MPVPKYKVFERVGRRTEPVTSFRDLEKHHPSRGREPGRDYDTIEGELEEVRRMPDGRILIKKDFFLVSDDGKPPHIPAPVAGYTRQLKDKTNALRIYSKPFGTPGARLLAQSLHGKLGTLPPDGTLVKRGDSIGVMGDVGSPGSIHAHLEMTLDDWKDYIPAIITGDWNND